LIEKDYQEYIDKLVEQADVKIMKNYIGG